MNLQIIKIYHQRLTSLKLDYTEQLVSTKFGKTNILVFGDEKKPSLFLIHGINSAAPFAIDTVSFLLKEYQIFAVDILGQPNKSDFVRLNKKDTSYGKWFLEIINHFKVDNVTLCGISFGGFPILKSLLIDDKKVKEVFLISPAGIINGSLLKTIFKFLIPMKKFQKTKKDNYLLKCLSSIYDEFDDLNRPFLKEVFLNFKIDFSVTPNFKTQELSTLKTQITIISSKNDFFVPAKKLKKRCKKYISNLKGFIVLENSKHIPSKEKLNFIFKKLISQNDK